MDSHYLPGGVEDEVDFSGDQVEEMLPETRAEAQKLEREYKFGSIADLKTLERELKHLELNRNLRELRSSPEEKLNLYVVTYDSYLKQLPNHASTISTEAAIQKLLEFLDFYATQNQLEKTADVLINLQLCKLICTAIRANETKSYDLIKEFINALNFTEVRSLLMRSTLAPLIGIFFKFFPTEISKLHTTLQLKLNPSLLEESVFVLKENESKREQSRALISQENIPESLVRVLRSLQINTVVQSADSFDYASLSRSSVSTGLARIDEDEKKGADEACDEELLRVLDLQNAVVTQANLGIFSSKENKRSQQVPTVPAMLEDAVSSKSKTQSEGSENYFRTKLVVEDLRLVLANPLLKKAEAEQIVTYLMTFITDIPKFKKALSGVIETLVKAALLVSADLNLLIAVHLNEYVEKIKDVRNGVDPRLQFEILQAIYLGLAEIACMNAPKVVYMEVYALRRRDIVESLLKKFALPSEVQNESDHVIARAMSFLIPHLTVAERSILESNIRGAGPSVLSDMTKGAFLKQIADVIQAEQEPKRSVVSLGSRPG